MGESSSNSGVSRRTVLLAAAGAAPLLALTTARRRRRWRRPRSSIRPDPKDGKQCDGCNFFVAPNSCKMVDGDIAPTGWCSLWVKKPAEMMARRAPAPAPSGAARAQARRLSRASASISTFISGFSSAETTTIVAAGRIAPKHLALHLQHRLAIGGVGDEGAQPHDVGELAARFLQHPGEGRVDVAGLLGEVVGHRHRRIVVAGRAGDMDLVAANDRARIAVSPLERRAGRNEAAIGARSVTRTP